MGGVQRPDRGTIYAGLSIASRAPSVHNTQPWQWRTAPHSLHLFADRQRALPVTDPHGRELTISCAASLHHAVLGFAALGWRTKVHLLPNPAESDHLAAIEFVPHPELDPTAMDLVAAAAVRRTDRRPFLPDRVPEPIIARLIEQAAAHQVVVTPVLDPVRRRELLVAMRHINASEQRDPAYVAELRNWSGMPLGAVEGVPATSLLDTHTTSRGMLGRDFAAGRLEGPPPLDDGALWLVMSTEHDEPEDWLRTGKALSGLLLSATEVGLASCTLSQVGEHATVRELVRLAALDGSGQPQLLVRLGWPSVGGEPIPRTPRRDVHEIVVPWPSDLS